MKYEFTAKEVERLEACRAEFNKLTRSRWSLQKFIQWSIEETIRGSEEAATRSKALRGVNAGGAHVH